MKAKNSKCKTNSAKLVFLKLMSKAVHFKILIANFVFFIFIGVRDLTHEQKTVVR
jgi:hypothetical protein